ncbi:hypothetical protein BBD42_06510 [Paenibacillus sp. BIHB 4019]|uniref:Phosphocarrier protein HPr n=1 Tax=Paenibacillus sp. BIHB 4019 TaxID=1870819 RepID=A0A1B2DEM3_9BACL|nr:MULTISPECIES: HPr family phosphocarrier protein [unclassified Paenibacillus]ANY66150.1 hypothetical protein BBD42_06510 [Paenibacillus sp. BIHB 4019]KQO18561.1 hypothetical protein ASF12_08160 [Paenibacillus sp. Leaf72]
MKSHDTLTKQNGFNVLFAKEFTTLASSFESEIRVIWQAKNIISDGKSILGLMALDIMKGTPIKLTAEGPDEDQAIEKLAALFEGHE